MLRFTVLLAVTILVSGSASAQDAVAEPTETEPPKIDSTFGVDATSDYFYRGILQESHGVIIQPWFDLSIPLEEDESSSWSLNTGIWNSLHTGSTGSGGKGSLHYELDAYLGVVVDFEENWTGSASYVVLSSPNSTFSSVQEIDFGISFDDSDSSFSVQPSATLAVELKGESDGGSGKGVYLGLGIEPSFELIEDEIRPVTASFPVAVGMSLRNYYEDDTGNDDFFGFAQVGAMLSTPLDWSPNRLGSWTLKGGVSALYLGENLEAINGGTSLELIATVGLEFAF